jgi:L-iditol 2-dehydrogenase
VRAIRIVAPGQAELLEVSDPRPAPGEVLVSVAYAAVCSTDRRLVRDGVTRPIPGHEVSGWLEDGTLVGIHPDTGCGRCDQCLAGRSQRCAQRRAVGIDVDGGFAERLVLPAAHAVPAGGIAADLIPLLEPLACTLYAARRLCVEPGETAVVVGSGAMGVLAMWALQALGLRVEVSQRSELRRRQAGDLGADGVLAPDDDPTTPLGRGPDVVVVTAPGPEPLTWALERVAEGGRVHAFAGSPGGAAVNANLVHYRHLDLVGSTGSGLADYGRAVELVRDGTVDLSRLPRAEIELDALPAELARPSSGHALRTIVRIADGVR